LHAESVLGSQRREAANLITLRDAYGASFVTSIGQSLMAANTAGMLPPKRGHFSRTSSMLPATQRGRNLQQAQAWRGPSGSLDFT
jgi:hypothetical protein